MEPAITTSETLSSRKENGEEALNSLNTVSRRHIFLHVVPETKGEIPSYFIFPLAFRNLESRDHVEPFIIEEEKWRLERDERDVSPKRCGMAIPFAPASSHEEDKDTSRRFRFVFRFIGACLSAM